jgi:hypothetical protein
LWAGSFDLNSALGAYQSAVGTINLGNIIANGVEVGCLIGNEEIGTLTPSSYTGNVEVHRLVLSESEYTNSTLTHSETNTEDTSKPSLRDDNPQSGGSSGKVYALDAPGTSPYYVDTNTYRLRINFAIDAELPGGSTRISRYYYYLRAGVLPEDSDGIPIHK